MVRPNRVFMTGSSIDEVTRRAKDKYSGHHVVDVKHDATKKPSRSAVANGNTKYYRVYLTKK